MAATYKYDPYGRTTSSSGTLASANIYRFSSKEIHPNSGFYYYGYRFYDPNTQRWLNRDPIEEDGGFNLYAFSRNCPVSIMDPDGRVIILPPWLLRRCPRSISSGGPYVVQQCVIETVEDIEDVRICRYFCHKGGYIADEWDSGVVYEVFAYVKRCQKCPTGDEMAARVRLPDTHPCPGFGQWWELYDIR